jgi:hypothetical protein
MSKCTLGPKPTKATREVPTQLRLLFLRIVIVRHRLRVDLEPGILHCRSVLKATHGDRIALLTLIVG